MKRTAKTRPKPSVADVNQQRAKENIHVKIHIISSALKPQSSGPVSVDDVAYETSVAIRELLPATVRQFNLWQSEDLPEAIRIKAPVFGKNANKTLHAAELYNDVQRTVDAVTASRAKAISESRAERISKYQGKADLANRLREIAEDEIIRLKRQLRSALDRNDVLARQLEELRARSAGTLKPVDNG
jgi:hypothetical protein